MTTDPTPLEMTVRDYECDVQGIVNNSVYLNYLEHARHRYLLERGIDFVDMAMRGSNMVVTRIEVDYLLPLRSADLFTVVSRMERVSRLRFAFAQEIRRPDGALVLRGMVLGTVVDADGRPTMPPELDTLLPEGDG